LAEGGFCRSNYMLFFINLRVLAGISFFASRYAKYLLNYVGEIYRWISYG
jgi:hypothetical protein